MKTKLLIVLLLIFALGCNSFTRYFRDKRTLSSVPPALPAPPRLAPMIKGSPEQQAIYFADLLDSPDTRLTGWLGLYDALGIPVVGQDGISLGSTGDDPIGPR